MLVHFPSALYPFSLVVDAVAFGTGDSAFAMCGLYALCGAVGISVVTMAYGLIDFVKIDTVSPAWKTAGIHALLNATWWMIFMVLLFYRLKHPEFEPGWIYLVVAGITTSGLFVSNYLGGELIIRHRIGIDDHES